MIEIIGDIGSNHEVSIPKKPFKKSSYPLPRDIVARILIRLGKPIINDLMRCIEGEPNEKKIEQAIDVLGHVSYTSGVD